MSEDWPHPELDAAEVLRVLGRHEVDYVLIGGLALALYGSNQLTFDIDLVPSAERANLDRLANAMRELHAKVIVYADPAEIHLSARKIFGPWTRSNDSGVTLAGRTDRSSRVCAARLAS